MGDCERPEKVVVGAPLLCTSWSLQNTISSGPTIVTEHGQLATGLHTSPSSLAPPAPPSPPQERPTRDKKVERWKVASMNVTFSLCPRDTCSCVLMTKVWHSLITRRCDTCAVIARRIRTSVTVGDSYNSASNGKSAMRTNPQCGIASITHQAITLLLSSNAA